MELLLVVRVTSVDVKAGRDGRDRFRRGHGDADVRDGDLERVPDAGVVGNQRGLCC